MGYEIGSVLEGKVTGITKFGVFVSFPDGKSGMVHISEVASTFVKEIRDFVTENQMVKVKIVNITDDGKIALSMKKAQDMPPRKEIKTNRPPMQLEWNSKGKDSLSFEDKLNKFKQDSDEKMLDLKHYMDGKRGSVGRRGSAGKFH
jgi:S1 RNA binding domain protein